MAERLSPRTLRPSLSPKASLRPAFKIRHTPFRALAWHSDNSRQHAILNFPGGQRVGGLHMFKWLVCKLYLANYVISLDAETQCVMLTGGHGSPSRRAGKDHSRGLGLSGP